MTDSILLDANASLDSLTLKEKGNEDAPIKKVKRVISNKTHISKTDPDATLAFKSGMKLLQTEHMVQVKLSLYFKRASINHVYPLI